jgi:hypothetical protein
MERVSKEYTLNNKILKTLALVVSLLFSAAPVSATLITDTVIVGDLEWAQVDDFTGLTWNEMNGVCPSGACTNGTLNSFDMGGWTWATAAYVGDNLLKPYFEHPGGTANTGWYDALDLTAFVSSTGFRITYTDGVNMQYLFGLTANEVVSGKSNIAYGGEVTIDEKMVLIETIVRSDGPVSKSQSNDNSGMWVYRSVAVPEPSTLAIFALGMIGLASRRFKKQS